MEDRSSGVQDRADRQDDGELGMAANSILQSIPPHILKALEQQQAEANEVNAESKVGHFPPAVCCACGHKDTYAETSADPTTDEVKHTCTDAVMIMRIPLAALAIRSCSCRRSALYSFTAWYMR